MGANVKRELHNLGLCSARNLFMTGGWNASELMKMIRSSFVVALLTLTHFAALANAQVPAFSAAAGYNIQPATVPVGVATGVFNSSDGGLLDFAVLEQVPNSGSYQVEIFHGNSNGTFCTNCGGSISNPDLIPLGSGVDGNAITVGQFRSGGPLDIAVATNTGIAFLQNSGSGTFTLGSNAISSANGFKALVAGQFNGDSNLDLAAVTPSVSGSVSFTVFFGDGSGNFPNQSSPYVVNNTYSACTEILQGNFQSQTSGADLAIMCNNPSLASVLVYLNSAGTGTYNLNQTLNAGNSLGGTLPGVALGTLNSQSTIFISPPNSSLVSFQSNGLAGSSNLFTTVSVGGAPQGSIAVLFNSSGAVDFASVNSGISVSTFTSYAQSNTSINGTWNSTALLGPNGVLSTGSSNLAQGTTYVVVDAGVHTGSYSDPNIQGPPNFEPYVDERSVNVFLATLNSDGTVASTNAAPVYPGTGLNGSAPPTFATGDFNGDGVMDLAIGGADLSTGNATVTIYLANSNGSLPAPPSSLPVLTMSNTPYSGADAVVAGKFRPPQNGKTLYDLAVFSSGQIGVFTSNGDGTFNSGNTNSISADPNYPGFFFNPTGGHPFAPMLTAVDVNGDGIDDVVLTLPEDNCNGSGNVSQGAVYILISNGDGTFQSPVFVAPPVVNPVSTTAAKFFGSGMYDLAFANGGELCGGNAATTTGTAVGILQNQVASGASSVTASEFTPAPILPQSSDQGVPNVSALASGDLNGDGQPDLVVSSTNGLQVLLNQVGGSFASQGVVPLYAGDAVPGPLCNTANNYVGCVTYDSQVTTGSFFATGETDVAVAVNGVVYFFQNNSGTLQPATQGFIAGPNSGAISGVLAGSNGLNAVLVATSPGTAYLANTAADTSLLAPTISEAFAPVSITVNGVTTLSYTVTNPNPVPLTGVEFADAFVQGLLVATPNGLTGSCGGGNFVATPGTATVSLTGATLAANSSCTVTINVTGTQVGTVNNSVTVSIYNGAVGNTTSATLTVNAASPPPAPVNITDNETITVSDSPSLPDVYDSETIHIKDKVSVITLQLITVAPGNPAIPRGATRTFTATGTFSDGSMQDLTSLVTWTSSNAGVASMSGATATGLAVGTATIIASLGSVSGNTTLTVQIPLVLVSAKFLSISQESDGSYLVAISVQNTGNIAATSVNALIGVLGTKPQSSTNPSLNLAPGSTGTVSVLFPASSGTPGKKELLLIIGDTTGTNPNGTPAVPTPWAVTETVTLP